ncbi:MAG: septum formation protein Maf [Candidatus Delongbacteria bacterium]|nr:septum formation protein Maf [bacterium]MBL7033058.1 septum formation protein Maf [Candidatus Delongbacteria bacterium]
MDLQCGQQIVLASASPRRRHIFANAGFQVEIDPVLVNETIPPGTEPAAAVQTLALSKAAAVAARYPKGVVVGADTIVYHQRQILEKPHDRAHACHMLQQLSGNWHTVFTGFALIKLAAKLELVRAVATRVKFVPLSKEFIEHYVASGEPLDKAGAYGIQEGGSLLVEQIEGCYFNVMGFPIAAFYLEFQRLFGEHTVADQQD